MPNPRLKFGFTANDITKQGEIKKKDIDIIKKWSEKEEMIPELTDEQVALFLLSCNNNHDATKTTIKSHYKSKKDYSDLFNNRKMERTDLQKQLRTLQIFFAPERTDDDDVIVFFRFYDTYYYNFDLGAFLTVMFMILDGALHDCPPKGLIFLIDMKGIGIMHLTRLRIGYIKAFFQYLQEGLPLKLKCMHFLNTVYFIERILRLIRPFAKREVMDVMNFHTSDMSMDDFSERFIPKKCLPKEYGGDLPTVQDLHEKNIEKLTELQWFFDTEELQRRID